MAASEAQSLRFKLIVVGDGGVGKVIELPKGETKAIKFYVYHGRLPG